MLSKKRFTEIVGNKVKALRNKKGITQDDLAHRCGFYRTYINLIETAKRSPSSYTVYRIARALKVPVDNLFPSTI